MYILIYIYVYIYICIYTCIYIFIYICIFLCVHIYIHVCMYIYIYKHIDTHIYLYIYLLYLCAGIYVHRIIYRFVRHITSLIGGAPRLLSDVASAGVQRSMTTSDSTARSTAIESRIFALESERTNPGSNRQQWTHPRITDHHQQNQEYTAFICFDCVSLCLLLLLKIS